MQDAINQVKSDLGRDAVILHTRRSRKGGIFGFFAKEQFEVMAALDSTPKINVATPVPGYFPTQATQVRQAAADSNPVISLRQDVSNLQKMVEKIANALPNNKQPTSPLTELLIKNDVDPEIAQALTKGMPDFAAESSMPVLKELLKERLSGYLRRVEVIKAETGTCKIAAFIGPTGVGKTTTIAKLAANFALREGRRVALITADTYRIAALEQLRTYADIIGVPLDVVYTPQELQSAIVRHNDKDIILVDTAGRSPKNQQQIQELENLLSVEPQMQIHLVLSTTTKYKEALEVVNRFSSCSPTKYLFTKIDEAANVGTIINLLHQFPAALSYITTGQNVPDDMEIADPLKLANMILRD